MSDQRKPFYAGAHIDDIVGSVRRTATFLKETITTPKAQDTLYDWLSCGPFNELAEAGTPKDVGDALRSTETLNILQTFHDVIAFHALADANRIFIDDQVSPTKLYASLAKWGAFDFDTVKFNTPLMSEVNAYLGVRYAKALNTDDLIDRNRGGVLKSTPTRQRFMHYTKYLQEKYFDYSDISTEVSKKLEAYTGFLCDVNEAGIEEAIEQYLTYDEKQQMMFAEFSKYCLGLHMRHKILQNMSPVKTYELSLNVMPIGSNVENRLERLLRESHENGDVRYIRSGELHNGEYGYLINGTEVAAKLVAAKFSDDSVYGPGGQRISSDNGGAGGGPERPGPSPT